MESSTLIDLWKFIECNWKSMSIVFTILGFVIGIAVRFSRVEDAVVGRSNLDRKPISSNKLVSRITDRSGRTKCVRIPEDTLNSLLNNTQRLLDERSILEEEDQSLFRVIDESFERLYKKTDCIEKKITDLQRDHRGLSDAFDKSEEHRIEGGERTELILKGVRASLDGLIEQGCNGPVKAVHAELNDYLNKKASR